MQLVVLDKSRVDFKKSLKTFVPPAYFRSKRSLLKYFHPFSYNGMGICNQTFVDRLIDRKTPDICSEMNRVRLSALLERIWYYWPIQHMWLPLRGLKRFLRQTKTSYKYKNGFLILDQRNAVKKLERSRFDFQWKLQPLSIPGNLGRQKFYWKESIIKLRLWKMWKLKL